jgi:tRNA 2-selenouridine synthase SelU
MNQEEKIEKYKSKELNKYIDTLESNKDFEKLKKLEATLNKRQEAIKKNLVEQYDNKDIEKMTNEEINNFLKTQDKIQKYKSIQNELLETFIKKNNDYGNNNLDTYGKIGIIIRMQDKINRYLNISKNNIEIKVDDENLNDTIKDLINYCYLFLIQE